MNSVGKGVIKKDAMALLTGQPVYCDYLAPKDCLVVKLLRSPHAYAKIRTIDTSIAKVYNCDLDHIDLDVYCADNMRGSKEYREKLVGGLTQKLLRKVESYVG